MTRLYHQCEDWEQQGLGGGKRSWEHSEPHLHLVRCPSGIRNLTYNPLGTCLSHRRTLTPSQSLQGFKGTFTD